MCVFFCFFFLHLHHGAWNFSPMFCSRFHCQRKQTWSHHFSRFLLINSMFLHWVLFRCQNCSNCFFSSHSCQKNMCFPSCPPHFPCMFHHFTILFHWFSIDVLWFCHDFTCISPAFSIFSIDFPWFHLHFPYFPLIFHDFTFISLAFSIFSMAFWLVVSGARRPRTRRSSPTRPSTAAGTSAHWTWRPRCATANGSITWCPGWSWMAGKNWET